MSFLFSVSSWLIVLIFTDKQKNPGSQPVPTRFYPLVPRANSMSLLVNYRTSHLFRVPVACVVRLSRGRGIGGRGGREGHILRKSIPTTKYSKLNDRKELTKNTIVDAVYGERVEY